MKGEKRRSWFIKNPSQISHTSEDGFVASIRKKEKVSSFLNNKDTNVIKISQVYCFSSPDFFHFAVNRMHLQITLNSFGH